MVSADPPAQVGVLQIFATRSGARPRGVRPLAPDAGRAVTLATLLCAAGRGRSARTTVIAPKEVS